MSEMRHIELEEDYGGVSGYVVSSTKEQVENYLSQHTEAAMNIATWAKINVPNVALLKNINVEEEEQGNGYGSALLTNFIDEAIGMSANAVILIADAGETQREGLSLEDWYQRHGFGTVLATGVGPVMVYPEEVAVELKGWLESVVG